METRSRPGQTPGGTAGVLVNAAITHCKVWQFTIAKHRTVLMRRPAFLLLPITKLTVAYLGAHLS